MYSCTFYAEAYHGRGCELPRTSRSTKRLVTRNRPLRFWNFAKDSRVRGFICSCFGQHAHRCAEEFAIYTELRSVNSSSRRPQTMISCEICSPKFSRVWASPRDGIFDWMLVKGWESSAVCPSRLPVCRAHRSHQHRETMPIHIMRSIANETANTDGIVIMHTDERLGLSRTVGRPRDPSCLAPQRHTSRAAAVGMNASSASANGNGSGSGPLLPLPLLGTLATGLCSGSPEVEPAARVYHCG